MIIRESEFVISYHTTLIENQNTSAGTLSKGENSFKYNKISAEVEGGVELYYKRRGIANWLPSNKTLVMTVKLRAGADYSPVDGKLILIRYRYVDSGTGKIVLDLPINSNSITQEWKEFSITGTTQHLAHKHTILGYNLGLKMGYLGK